VKTPVNMAGFSFVIVLFCSPVLFAQSPQPVTGLSAATPNPVEGCLTGAVRDLKERLALTPRQPGLEMINVSIWPEYVCYFSTSPLRAQLLGKAEESRLDKQAGSGNNTSGSTSAVSKGSAPSLLGFALEHGGLTQSSDGNTITFRGNVTNSIAALRNSSYVGSYELVQKDPLLRELSKISFGISFDASSSQTSNAQGFAPSANNLSGFSTKYQVLNHRDPRDHRWYPNWATVEQERLRLAKALLHLDAAAKSNPDYKTWEALAVKTLSNLSSVSSDEDIRRALESLGDAFRDLLLSNDPVMQRNVRDVTSQTTTYLSVEKDILDTIRTSTVVTVEYNYDRQRTPNNLNVVATQANQTIPSLSKINLVIEKGVRGVSSPEFTFNAGVTLFDSSGAKRGVVRDYCASAQVDIPLKEITNVGRPVLSFSGEFLGLLEEPIGQKVTLNGVTIDRRGNIGLFQTKLSIPIKDSGVKIPVSFTYASRTELVKEKDVRGNIGITFDLDTLFSKAK
jgi:hypothetical protein